VRGVSALPPVTAPLREALGLVIAEDVRAPLDLPPWDNASMDGYAVRADDVSGATPEAPRTLTVVATIAAGARPTRGIARGEAMRIMTGAPVPPGADSIVRVEDTDAGVGMVRITSDRDAGRNIRPRGEDVAINTIVVAAGTALHPAHLGVLASVGRSHVRVHPRPRVAILASGDELVDVDRFAEVLAGGDAGAKIVSSNTYTLEASVRQAGGAPVMLGTVPDDPAALRKALGALDCDLLLTSGGVSVGAFDYTRQVLDELGLRQEFWRVKIRPGAPAGFGSVAGVPWLGLPGNPVSAMVTFELFARPAIRTLCGHADPFRRVVPVVLEEIVSIGAPLTHFLRAHVRLGGAGWLARLTGPQGSGLLTSRAAADALLVVPPEKTRTEPGEVLDALFLRDEVSHGAVPLTR
jgi:molybdopterin molybdotransferase